MTRHDETKPQMDAINDFSLIIKMRKKKLMSKNELLYFYMFRIFSVAIK